MSQATLTFQLPEEDREHIDAVNGWKWRSLVFDILQNIRQDVKYSEETTEEQKKVLENMRSFIYKRMGEENLSLDD
jgi:hypothetical protein